MRAVLQTDALILRAVDYRDTDRILTLFTRDQGVLSAVARGAKGSRRRFQGILEPYAVLAVELDAPRGDLYTLKSAELRQVFSGVLSDLNRMQAAGAALRLVRELGAQRVADPRLFFALLQYLTLVDHVGDGERAALLVFALRLLSLAGLGLGLTHCGRSGDPVPPGRPAYFEPSVGAIVAARFGGGPVLLSAALRQRMVSAQGEQWLDEARTAFRAEDLACARSALSAFIACHAPADVGACLFPT